MPNDWINLENPVSGKTGQTIQAQIDTTANPIVEATSWEVDNSGQMYLVASTQDVQSQLPVQKIECNI